MNKSLVIVQDVPTQFDAPLYNQISLEGPYSLFVIYTKVATLDPEIGRLPHWDHIEQHCYDHHFLDNTERGNVENVVQKILKRSPDHVIVSGYWPKLHRDVMKVMVKKGISVGLRSDNTIHHSKLSGVRGFVKKLFLRSLLGQYDMWHPAGDQAADYLKLLSGEQRPISLFPYNVDNQWFRACAQKSRGDRAASMSEIGFPQDCYIILGIMKWAEREDPMTLMRAFEKYQAHNASARLILIGDGPLRVEVEEYANRLKGLVYLPGYMKYSRLPGWYGLADVFVHPAPDEPWGVSVNEALASGVPVIASTGVGAALELVSQGFNGSIFKEGDDLSLVTALKEWFSVASSISSVELEQRCRHALHDWGYETTIQSFQEFLKND